MERTGIEWNLPCTKKMNMNIGNTQYCKSSEYFEVAIDDILVEDNSSLLLLIEELASFQTLKLNIVLKICKSMSI